MEAQLTWFFIPSTHTKVFKCLLFQHLYAQCSLYSLFFLIVFNILYLKHIQSSLFLFVRKHLYTSSSIDSGVVMYSDHVTEKLKPAGLWGVPD
jgi:hypothetical protein